MKCPYCDNEMEAGLMQSPQEIAWMKGNKYRTFNLPRLEKDSVVLSKLNFRTITGGFAVRAYLCRNCKKIVIDYARNKDE